MSCCGSRPVLFLPSRMIMNTHRDLEAFKRLSYRKAKPASVPYIPKGAGPHPRGEQSWRNV